LLISGEKNPIFDITKLREERKEKEKTENQDVIFGSKRI
jgi:hypothetical protein